MVQRLSLAIAVMVLLIAPCSVARAQCDATWTNSGGGNWEAPSNWESDYVPEPGDAVCITAGGIYTVVMENSQSIGSLLLDAGSGLATLEIHNAFSIVTLEVSSTVTVTSAGKIRFDNSTIVTGGGGSLINDGRVELINSTIEVDLDHNADLTWLGDSSINGNLTTSSGSDMRNLNVVGAPAHLTVASGFTLNGTISFASYNQVSLTVDGPLTIGSTGGIFAGSVSKERAPEQLAEVPITAEILNSGHIQTYSFGLRFDAASAAHVNFAGGTIGLEYGDIVFDLTGGVKRAASSFTNGGTLSIGTGIKTSQIEPALSFIGGTVTHTGSVEGNGFLRLISTSLNASILENTSNVVELIEMTVASDSSVYNASDLIAKGAVQVFGVLDNSANGSLQIAADQALGGASLDLYQGFSNSGRLDFVNASAAAADLTLAVSNGPLINQTEGEIYVNSGFGGVRTLAAEIDNRGLLELVDSDLTIEGQDFAHSNNGTILMTGGNLVLDLSSTTRAASSFTNGGTLSIGDGLNCTAGVAKKATQGLGPEAASSFTNGGTLSIGTGSTFLYSGAEFENGGQGTVEGNGELDVSGADSATNRGHLSPGSSPGTLTVVGNLDQGLTAKLDIEIGGPPQSGNNDLLEVIGQLNLRGSLDVALVDPYQPNEGDQFTVATFTSRFNAFDGFSFPGLLGGLTFSPDIRSDRVVLDIVCGAGPDLSVDVMADIDPVRQDNLLTYSVVVTNNGPMPATSVVVTDVLPLDMIFEPGASSLQCDETSLGIVECGFSLIASGASRVVDIAVVPMVTGEFSNVVTVEAGECEQTPENNSDSVTVTVLAADPCDADNSGWIDQYDLPAAVGHIFGTPADGNPNCAEDTVIDALDLAAIIIAADENNK